MTFLLVATDLIHQMGITFGVGASTFALTFFIMALRDGVMDQSERACMHAVFFVLRIGMAFIFLSLVSYGFLAYYAQMGSLFGNAFYLMEWTLIGIITINAVLMTKRQIPMWLAAPLAGGSWYALFLVTSLPLQTVAYVELLIGYVVFFLIFLGVFTLIRQHYSPQPQQVPQMPK